MDRIVLDKLRQIAIFAKTIEHGSFKAAADDLRLAPSVVSHHISQLEEKLGVTLIYRSTRKLNLTHEGKRLLEAAHIMQEAIEGALDELNEHSRELSGVLRITITSGLSQSFLMDAVAKVCRRHPKIEVNMEFTDTRRHLIDDGFDLAIQVGSNKDKSFDHKTLFEGKRCIVGARTYLAKRGAVHTPQDLDACDWVVLAGVRGAKPILRRTGGRRAQIEPKGQIHADSSLAVYQLVKAGAGIAIVPKFLTSEDVANGVVEILLPQWKIGALDVVAEWHSNAPKDGLVRLFVSELAEVAQALEYQQSV